MVDGALPDGQPVARAEIEMLRGVPVLRLPRPPVPDQTINLADGSGVSTLDSGGPDSLNRISASISGTSAGIRLPRGGAAWRSKPGPA